MLRSNNKPAILLNTDASSIFAEAYRNLRINIDFHAVESVRTIAVTSTSPGEGKTTTALHLASAYAAGGKSVVLVDGDTRKPSLHHLIGRTGRIGLTDYLAEPGTLLFDIIQDSRIERVSLITAGTMFINPSDLLVNGRLETLMEELKKRFDIVIVDTTPVLAAIDAKIMAGKCDGVLFVVESGKIKRNLVKKAVDELKQGNANIIGAALNKVKEKDTGYRYPYYS